MALGNIIADGRVIFYTTLYIAGVIITEKIGCFRHLWPPLIEACSHSNGQQPHIKHSEQ